MKFNASKKINTLKSMLMLITVCNFNWLLKEMASYLLEVVKMKIRISKTTSYISSCNMSWQNTISSIEMVLPTVKEYIYFFLLVTGTCKKPNNPDWFRMSKLYGNTLICRQHFSILWTCPKISHCPWSRQRSHNLLVLFSTLKCIKPWMCLDNSQKLYATNY